MFCHFFCTQIGLRNGILCCVFQPANGCSACCSLVEINFLMLKQLFLSLAEQNKEKRKEIRTKTCNKRVCLYLLRYFPHLMNEKDVKICFNVKKICWSICTTILQDNVSTYYIFLFQLLVWYEGRFLNPATWWCQKGFGCRPFLTR